MEIRTYMERYLQYEQNLSQISQEPLIDRQLTHDKNLPHMNQPLKSIKPQNLRRSKRLAKKCAFHHEVMHSDGTNSPLKTSSIIHVRRILKFPSPTEEELSAIDQKHMGHFHTPPSLSGSKITHIHPNDIYNRTCMCSDCSLQISTCRQTPCYLCIQAPQNPEA